jgi:hypothetical protein
MLGASTFREIESVEAKWNGVEHNRLIVHTKAG